MSNGPFAENSLNLIAEGSRLEGRIRLAHLSRVHGALVGEVESAPGSILVIAESGWVEGNIQADTLIVDGFVRGDIVAATKVTLSSTGRVIGNIRAPKVAFDFGCHFEGSCKTGEEPREKARSSRASEQAARPSPA